MTNQQIAQQLANKNTKPTSMRILIYDLLESHHSAMSISDIEKQLVTADRTTIYRTLKTFEEKGIVHHIQEDNGSRYMLCHDGCDENSHKDWHLHFYCKICKQTSCREDVVLPESIRGDFRIDEIRFFAKGICEHCLENV